MSKHVFISGAYFPVFGLNTGKYGPEITTYLDTFHAVTMSKHENEQLSNSNIRWFVWVGCHLGLQPPGCFIFLKNEKLVHQLLKL